MKKSLVALAVAASAAAPAMAQVTISGFFNASYDSFSVNNVNATRTGRLSEDRVTDNASRIIFNASEDLGGGMRAIGQFDLRVAMDAAQPINPIDPSTAGANRPSVNPINQGNNHVGLVTGYGTFRIGRQDIQYTENAGFNPVGTATIANHAGVFHGVSSGAAATTIAMTNATRTANLIWWVSPRWNGIEATAGYSTNPLGVSSDATQAENDLAKVGAGSRKGGGTYFKLDSDLGKLRLVYSQVDLKSDYTGLAQGQGTGGARGATGSADYTGAAVPDHNGKVLTGKYNLGNGWNVGLGMSRNKGTDVITAVSTTQNATQFGLGYISGAHQTGLTYTSAGDRKLSSTGSVANSGVTAVTLAYGYNLSKRTQLHASYVVLDNDVNAATGLFYNGATVMTNTGTLAGERHSAYSLGVRHSF